MDKNANRFELKSVLFTLISSWLSSSAVVFVMAFILQKIDRYERFFGTARTVSYLCFVLSVYLFSKLFSSKEIFTSLITGAVSALLVFGLSLAIKGESVRFVNVLASLSVIAFAPGIVSLFDQIIKAYKPRKNKFKFK